MRILVITLVILLFFSNRAFPNTSKELEELRLSFYSAIEDDDNMQNFKAKLTTTFGEYSPKTYPLGIAYWGVFQTLIAKHSFNPYTKLKELKNGLETIQQAINKDENNLEIRFLRFSVLHHIPDFLGYKDEKKEDAKKITELLKNQDYSLLDFKFQKGIAEFMIKSKRIDKDNIQKLTDMFLK